MPDLSFWPVAKLGQGQLGGFLWGAEGAKWGAGIGFAVALLVFAGGSYAFVKGIRGR